MNKRLLNNALLLVVMALLITSCKSKSGANYNSYISANNELYLSIDSEQLVTKSNFKNQLSSAEQTIINGMLLATIRQELFDIVEPIINNPYESGIDFSKKTHITVPSLVEAQNNQINLSIYSAVKNRKKLDNLITAFINLDNSIERTSVKDFTVVAIDKYSPVYLLYNEVACIITTVTEDNLKDFLSPAKPISEVKELAEAINDNSDLSMVYNIKSLLETNNFRNNPIIGALKNTAYGELLDDSFQQLTINFNKGDISFNQNILNNNKEVFNKFDVTTKVKHNHTPFIKKDPIIYSSMGIDGVKLYNLLEEIFSALPEQAQIDKEFTDIASKVLSSIYGDMTFIFSGLEINFFTPKIDASLLIDTKDKTLFSTIEELLTTKNLGLRLNKENDNLLLIGDQSFSMYIGYTDEFTYFTTDKAYAKNPTAKVDENISLSRYYEQSRSKNNYFVLDLDKLLKIPFIQMGMSSVAELKQESIKNLINELDYIEGYTKKDKNNESKIILKEKNTNSLELITNTLMEFAREQM